MVWMDPLLNSQLQLLSAIVIGMVFTIVALLIYIKDRHFFLNKIFAIGNGVTAIGCLASGIGLMPYALLGGTSEDLFIVVSNQIFYWATIITLTCYLIGGIYLWKGEEAFNKEFIACYFILIALSFVILFLTPNAIIGVGTKGEFEMSDLVLITIFPLIATLLLINILLFWRIYQKGKIQSILYFVIGLVVILIASLFGVLKDLLNEHFFDLVAYWILGLGSLFVYRGFSLRAESKEDIIDTSSPE